MKSFFNIFRRRGSSESSDRKSSSHQQQQQPQQQPQNSQQTTTASQQQTQQAHQEQQQQQQQQSNTSAVSTNNTETSSSSSSSTSSASNKQEGKSTSQPKPARFSFTPNTVKPQVPSDPEDTSFTLTVPELWAHRQLEESDDDEDTVHVCQTTTQRQKITESSPT